MATVPRHSPQPTSASSVALLASAIFTAVFLWVVAMLLSIIDVEVDYELLSVAVSMTASVGAMTFGAVLKIRSSISAGQELILTELTGSATDVRAILERIRADQLEHGDVLRALRQDYWSLAASEATREAGPDGGSLLRFQRRP